jgi:phosphatidylserine/phosphatidylglycerophosphate/cardiolipin synthase-like enzyme
MNRVRIMPVFAARAAVALSILLVASSLFAQTGELEIVESIPLETSLDNPGIRNTAQVWLAMIGAAKTSLDIEQFYVSDKSGEALSPVVTAIEAAAARGVAVRVIVDKKFHATYPETVDRWSTTRNMRCRVVDFTSVAGGAVQHAKFFLVDGEHVFLGSQNFDWRSLSHIHEIGLRLRSKRVADEFSRIFEMDWTLAASGDTAAARRAVGNVSAADPIEVTCAHTADDEPTDRTATITPVFSPAQFLPANARWDGAVLQRMLAEATREIDVQVMSYAAAGDFELDASLRAADARGVNVRLLVSDWSLGKNRLSALRSLHALPHVTVRRSAIPPHSAGFIPFARVEHCKYLVIDDARFWVGTNNWSKDYFRASRNVGIAGTGACAAAILKSIFERSWNSAYAEDLDPDKEYAPPKTNDGSGK